MSVALLSALYTTAVAALDADDFDAAIRAALKAKLIIGTAANTSRGVSGGGSQQVGWYNGAQIDAFIAGCKDLQAAASNATSGVFQQSLVNYVRPSLIGEA